MQVSSSTNARALRPLGSLKASFSWTFVGNLVYAISQWLMLMLMAKMGSPETVGQYALGLSITAPILILTNLQLRGIQATDARREFVFPDYLGLRLIGAVTGVLASVLCASLLGGTVTTALVVSVVGVNKGIESVSDIFYGLFQQNERMDIISKSMILKGVLSLGAFVLGLYAHGLVVAVLLQGATWLLLLLAYDIRLARVFMRQHSTDGPVDLRPRWNVGRLRALWALALPMGFASMLSSLAGNIPRYFVEHQLGLGELGVFSALAYLIVAGRTLESAMGQAASPRLAYHYVHRERRNFQQLLCKLLVLGGIMGVAGVVVSWLAGKQVLTLLYRSEYGDRADLLVWLMGAAAFQYLFGLLGAGITAMRRFRVQLTIHGMNTVLLTGLSAWLVPVHGLVGAAIAMLVSSIGCVFAYAWEAVRALRQATEVS